MDDVTNNAMHGLDRIRSTKDQHEHTWPLSIVVPGEFFRT